MSKRALPVAVALVLVAAVALVYSVARTLSAGPAAPTSVGTPAVNNARARALYMRTHGGAQMPGGAPGSSPAQPSGRP